MLVKKDTLSDQEKLELKNYEINILGELTWNRRQLYILLVKKAFLSKYFCSKKALKFSHSYLNSFLSEYKILKNLETKLVYTEIVDKLRQFEQFQISTNKADFFLILEKIAYCCQDMAHEVETLNEFHQKLETYLKELEGFY